MDMFKASSPLQETVTVEACIIEHAKQLEYDQYISEDLKTMIYGD